MLSSTGVTRSSLAEDREERTREPLESRAGIVVEPAADELDLRVVTRAVTVIARGCLDGLEVGSAAHQRHESVLRRERAGHGLGGSSGCSHVGFGGEAFLVAPS